MRHARPAKEAVTAITLIAGKFAKIAGVLEALIIRHRSRGALWKWIKRVERRFPKETSDD